VHLTKDGRRCHDSEAVAVTLCGKLHGVDALNEKRFFVLAPSDNRFYFSLALVVGVSCAGEVEAKPARSSSARRSGVPISLMKGHAECAVEEAICVLMDVLQRKFPGEFGRAIGHACGDLDGLKHAREGCARVDPGRVRGRDR
jgi:hypothetical protein